MITQASSTHTMPINGNGVAALGKLSGANFPAHEVAMHQVTKQKQLQSLRGSSFIANLLRTTAMFWACEHEDYRSPGGISA